MKGKVILKGRGRLHAVWNTEGQLRNSLALVVPLSTWNVDLVAGGVNWELIILGRYRFPLLSDESS